ncbi:MAG TPA: HAMP domain-containing sensor histidine kinase [Myxococcales bacterium]|nr:HAMP domain-containing sensor histidine kinase [Myxococcales bacterium]
MAAFLSALRRHALWVGLAAVVAPLLVLLSLQYRSLSTLKRTWALAHRTSLESFLAEVGDSVEEELGASGEKLLRVPAAAFKPGRAELAAEQFARESRRGFRGVFLYVFEPTGRGTLLWFDEKTRSLAPAGESPASHAAILAASHWKLFSERAVPLESTPLSGDERDPDHRLLMVPITDVTSRVVGVAGAELDPDYVARTILPAAIQRSLASHFAEDVRRNLVVTVRNQERKLVFATENVEGQQDETSGPLTFVLKDWRVGIRSRDYTPEQFARSNFAVNVALSGVLAAVLVGGVALALRTASRELKLSQMKSDFVSNVSHELKTPLASIRLFGELMRLGRVTSEEKVKEYGAFIDAESRRLTQLITNILDSSRIESGKKEYVSADVELGDLVTEVLKSFEVIVRHQGYVVRFDRPAGPVVVEGDFSALAQVVHNLLDNAIKYSAPKSAIELQLGPHRGQARLLVRDQGIGIATDEQQKIFERFHRVSTGLLHEVRGSGLGLSIVKHVVEAHGGRIEVESALGKGSTFALYLPLAQRLAEPELAARAAAGGEP